MSRTLSVNYDGLSIYPDVVTDSLGHSTQVRFDERFGLLETTVDPNGLTSGYSYDGFGRVSGYKNPTTNLAISYQDGPHAAPTFGALEVVRNVVDGPTTFTTYDPKGNVVSTESTGFHGQVFSQEFTYDWAGRLVTEARPHATGDASQGVISFNYDLAGRLIQQTFPNGNVVSLTYSNRAIEQGIQTELLTQPGGNDILRMEDSDGVVRLEARDYMNTLVSSIDGSAADASVMRYSYGPHGTLNKITDALGNATELVHDSFGRMVLRTDPDSNGTIYAYDSFGEIEGVFDALNRSTEFSYDALGRISSYVTHGTQNDSYSFAYDGPGRNEIGRLVGASCTLGNGTSTSTQIEYDDDAGLPSTVTKTFGGKSFSTTMLWDPLGRIAEIDYPPSGGQPFNVKYAYDPAGGDLERIDQTGASGPVTLWSLTASDSGFRPKTFSYGNGTTTTFAYDPAGGLPNLISTKLADGTDVRTLNYSYSPGNKMVSRTDSQLNRVEGFHYDTLGRLVNRSQTIGSFVAGDTIAYNAIGNIVSMDPLGSYAYDGSTGGGPHAVSKVGDTQYEYDAVGHMVRRSGSLVPLSDQQFTYNGRDDLVQIEAGSGSTATTVAYTYDALGEKVLRNETQASQPSNSTQTFFVGDSYSETDDAGQAIHRYRVLASSGQVAEFSRTVNSDGTIAAQNLTYAHLDTLGSSVDVSDSQGVVARRSFSPFGQLEDGSSSLATTDSGFTGHRHESDLGLIDMRGRFYDPTVGRFLSTDPILLPFHSQGMNPYSYALNSPVNWVDPSGYTVNWPGGLGGPPGPLGGTQGGGLGDCDPQKQDCKGGGTVPGTSVPWNPIDAAATQQQQGTSAPPPDPSDGNPIDLTNTPGFTQDVVAPRPDPGTGNNSSASGGPSGGWGSTAASGSGSQRDASAMNAAKSALGTVPIPKDKNGQIPWYLQYPDVSLGLGGVFEESGLILINLLRGLLGEELAPAAETVARGTVSKLARSLFRPLQCIECANAMVDALKKSGISGEVLNIRAGAGDFIASDLVRSGTTSITENGFHQAVRVGDLVFDNYFREGVPYQTYVDSLHAVGGVTVTGVAF